MFILHFLSFQFQRKEKKYRYIQTGHIDCRVQFSSGQFSWFNAMWIWLYMVWMHSAITNDAVAIATVLLSLQQLPSRGNDYILRPVNCRETVKGVSYMWNAFRSSLSIRPSFVTSTLCPSWLTISWAAAEGLREHAMSLEILSTTAKRHENATWKSLQ